MALGNGTSLTTNKLTDGEVALRLGNQEIVLRPKMLAWTTLSRQFGGLAKLRQALLDENVDAIISIIRVGAGLENVSVRRLEARVFSNGIDGTLLTPLLKYIAILNNGGRDLPQDTAEIFDQLLMATSGTKTIDSLGEDDDLGNVED